jgi:hypothetical protein
MSPSDHDLLIAMNTKLDMVLLTSTDHETRVRRLERWFWIVAGMAAASGAGISTAFGLSG